MQKLIELENYPNILVSSNLLNYDKPDYIYIPINNKSELLVHKDEEVLIGDALVKNGKEILISSVSGKVINIEKVNTINGIEDALKIENDFQDKRKLSVLSNLKKVKKEEIDLFITLKKGETLVINCIDDEPCVVTENFYLFKNSLDYLELLDYISNVYSLKEVIIAVKSISSENISSLMNYLGMYLNIKLKIIPNLYLLGKTPFLESYLNLDKDTTKILMASEFYPLCLRLKKSRDITSKYITITGDNITNPSVVQVRIGASLKDIVESLFKIPENSILIVNGLMSGKETNLDLIITKEVHSVFIMQKKKVPKRTECIRCSACIKICPVGINPLKNKKDNRCIECGLCSYICPSYIDFKEGGNQNE